MSKSFFLTFVLVFILVFCVYISKNFKFKKNNNLNSQLVPVAANAGLNFLPQLLPLETNVPNPDTGMMQTGTQDQQNQLPPNWQHGLQYERPSWSEVQGDDGKINETWFNNRLAYAKARGTKFGFRIMSHTYGSPVMPNFADLNKNDTNIFNNASYLAHVEDVLNKIAAKYGNDPRLGWVEVGFYGNWAEWHISGMDGYTAATTESKKRILLAHIKAFPTKQIVVMTDDGETMDFAMRGSALINGVNTNLATLNIGLRRDSVGSVYQPSWGEGKSIMDNMVYRTGWDAAKDRYKTAPFIAETIELHEPAKGDYCRVAQHVANYMPNNGTTNLTPLSQYHISSLSSHNYNGGYTGVSADKQTCLLDGIKRVGYRYATQSVTVEGANPYTITTTWVNQGNSPTYNNWDVYYRFVNKATGQIITDQKSNFNLKSLTDTNTTKTVTESFNISATNGTVSVYVVVKDVLGYFANMNLAQNNKTSLGYYIGDIGVAAAVTPQNATSTVAQATVTPIVPQSTVAVATATQAPQSTQVPTQAAAPTQVPQNTQVPIQTQAVTEPAATRAQDVPKILLNIKVRLQGITTNAKKIPALQKFKVSLGGADLVQNTDLITNDFRHIGGGVFEGTVEFVGIKPSGGFKVMVKGPKHLQKRFCTNKPKPQTTDGQYSCTTSGGDITLTDGQNNLDFSAVVLPVGDLPVGGRQDSVADALDLTFIQSAGGSTEPKDLSVADVNYDGVVDTQDYVLILNGSNDNIDEG